MFSMIILLVAVLAAHPSYGAMIPDINSKPSESKDAIRKLPSVDFQPNTKNMMTNMAEPNYATTAPPKKATFITECDVGSLSDMMGLCWLDETTVLMLDHLHGGRIIKYDIDIQIGFCSREILYTNVYGWQMSCPSNGEIYIADGSNKVVRIITGGIVTEWKPDNTEALSWGGMAVNDNRIALDFHKAPVNLYNRQRELNSTLSSEADKYNKYHLSLSPSSSHLVASASSDGYVFIHDLINNQTIQVGGSGKEEGKLDWPATTSFDASEKYVLVCEDYNDRFSVFRVNNGSFVHVLDVGPGGSNSKIGDYHATIHRAGKASLLAVEMMDGIHDTIKIYSLTT